MAKRKQPDDYKFNFNLGDFDLETSSSGSEGYPENIKDNECKEGPSGNNKKYKRDPEVIVLDSDESSLDSDIDSDRIVYHCTDDDVTTSPESVINETKDDTEDIVSGDETVVSADTNGDIYEDKVATQNDETPGPSTTTTVNKVLHDHTYAASEDQHCPSPSDNSVKDPTDATESNKL